MAKKDEIFEIIIKLSQKNQINKGFAATEIAEKANISRSNASRYLNELYLDNKIIKENGRPVIYKIKKEQKTNIKDFSFDNLIGAKGSLKTLIQQAKAAVLYPPNGLHTLLLGETGVGKSMFAQLMYYFALEENILNENSPFITFNCADYADNPQLLIGQLFGIKKGAYTGADRETIGIFKKADGGMVFLDEIHRLPPQGQEMLFTFIDNGYFRKLGEADKKTEGEVKIISATTESPDSFLLKTFQRRIPMVINLPSLNERSLEERYLLIEEFIKNESIRINKEILLYKNALKSFLLYDCPNNIGQLKSDIQLACAKAFLSYKAKTDNTHKDTDSLKIGQQELPRHVKIGIMNLPDKREELTNLINGKRNLISFSKDIAQEDILNMSKQEANIESSDKKYFFYDQIEKKINSLEENGVSREEINEILNIDIEKHFQRYIGNISNKFRKSKIDKVVGKKIVSIVDKVLGLASNRLSRNYDQRIYYGLALHLKRSIERINNGEEIYHPKLNDIRINHSKEFITAMEIASIIDREFSLETPLDEIGYLSMFLTDNPYDNSNNDLKNNVGILVIMHGKTTASSTADVVNRLVGEEYVAALNMPLDVDPQVIYNKAKSKVIEMDRGNGVILMVDMGSLNSFAEMIEDETSIETATIKMSSTPLVLEACRKAILGNSIEEILLSVEKIGEESYQQDFKVNHKSNNNLIADLSSLEMKKPALVTACFSGEGAAVDLKSILEENINTVLEYDIINLSLMNKKKLKENIIKLKSDYNLLALIGTVNADVDDLEFISAVDIFNGIGLKKIKEIFEVEQIYYKMKNSLKEHLNSIDSDMVVSDVRIVMNEIEDILEKRIDSGVKIGILLHIVYMVDSLKSGNENKVFKNLENYINNNRDGFAKVKKILDKLSLKYDIQIDSNEVAYIHEMFINN